jgi:SPP1 family predicted phage head-tail adaptor
MRAGLMDRVLILQRVTTAATDSGAVSETWNNVVTLRAQLVSTAIDEINKAQGDTTNINVTFRTRWCHDVRLSDRLIFQDQLFNITQTKEIGRRRGLEIKAIRVGEWKRDAA